MVLIISTISLIVRMASIEQKANAATSTTTNINTNTINCQSKKGGTNTAPFGTLKYAGGKCTGQNGGTVAAGGIMSDQLSSKNTTTNTNTINCQSKKGGTSNLTQVLLARTVLKDLTTIPILEDSLEDKNIYRTE
jgi:hypothetical protein